MSRPKDPSYSVRTWATDASYSAGPDVWNGQPTKVEPPSSATGWVPDEAAGAEEFNKLFYDAYTIDANAKDAIKRQNDHTGLLQLRNFAQSVSQSFVAACWNPAGQAWFGIETTTNCKASFDAGWTWGANVISGADTLQRIASDPNGNMVITTTGNDCETYHHYTAATSTWARVASGGLAGGSVATLGGKVCVVYDVVHGKWVIAAKDVGIGADVDCAISSNRTSWTAKGFSYANLDSVELAYGNGKLVMVGRYNTGGLCKVWTSSDGLATAWTMRTDIVHGFTTGTAYDLKYNADEDLFMLVVGNGSTACKVYTSPDGISWTARATSVTKCITKIVACGNAWLGTLSTGVGVSSVDSGATWQFIGYQFGTPVALATSGEQLLAICSSTVFPGLMAGLCSVAAL